MGERRGTKALEIWCKRMTEGYLNVKIDNMTTSWRNGLAFCAMIHHFRPDLIEFDKLNKNDIYYNNDLAFRTAEQYLGIPALLDADDMASYEVPDRLSILTYLSQFYQVFASQDSPNRLKRNSTSTVETTVSKSAGPPSKMAHIVGVPKREPCLKCSLPVFLAERLIIGKAVYHRTCLKCARCKTQLTIGSFYETEIDGEFCCETCPDEEQTDETFSITDDNTDNYHTSNLNITLSPNSNTETKNNRSSIADRLAFFEMNISCGDGKKLLQKSLSDEEKSKSLKKITEFKPNIALTNFMKSTINDDKKSDDDDSADDSEYIQNVENSVCIPPMLPKTIPPSVSLQEQYEENLQDNSTSSAENESNILVGNINTGTYDALDSSTILPINKTQNNNNNNKYNNNDPNVSVNVTKEDDSNSTVKQNNVHMRKTAELYIQQLPDSDIEISTKIHNSDETDRNDSPEQNVIRSRLHQFDVINKSGSENNASLNKNTSSSVNDNKILSINSSNEINNIRINLVDNRSDEIVDDSKHFSICKEEEKVPKYTDSKEEQNNFKLINNISNDNTSYLQENVILKNVDIKSSPEKQVVVNAETIIITNNKPVETIQNNKIEDEHEHIKLLEDDKQQMNTICKTNDKIENQESILITKKEADDENDEISIEINSVENNMQSNQHVEERSTLLRQLNVEYPEELNPFQSDDNDDEDNMQSDMKKKRKSLNPFGSSDEDDDNEDGKHDLMSDKKLKPPRPPPPKISNNPFGSGSENDEETESINITTTTVSSNIGNSSSKKLPIPTPRTQICSSLKKQTPESTPIKNLNNCGDYYGSSASLNAAANNSGHREIFHRHHEVRGSNTSLTSSTNGGSSRKSKKAPAPPPPSTTTQLLNITKELFGPDPVNSTKSSPNSSSPVTPQQPRKKRPAPKPPAIPKIEIEKIGDEIGIKPIESVAPITTTTTVIPSSEIPNTTTADFKQSLPEIGKLSDEEKAANLLAMNFYEPSDTSESETEINESQTPRRRLISLDKSLLEDISPTNDVQLKEEHNVIYRRSIRPPLDITTPTKNNGGGDLIVSFPISLESATHNRQLEKMKDNKEAKNRNRQSQCSDDSDPLVNKSTHGKWKRRKGPAPSLPIPPRKVLQMLPLQEIRHELEIIEVQQQGLEKQGVILETMIRERCETKNGKLNDTPINNDVMDLPPVQNSKEVEDLILQLFELVNEKNELFRRQAELMYLRRQHRLEQEQADLEYEIRVLMAQPERNKTDTDKAREEALIARLVEVVQLRNEVIECLEMDRLREAEEDLSIKQRLELHTAKRDEELNKQTPTKLSKKEKKKQKETKKMGKCKKLDADKDADESEVNAENQKDKKKKKKFLF